MGSPYETHNTDQPSLLGIEMWYFCYIKYSHKEMILLFCMSPKPAMKVILKEKFPKCLEQSQDHLGNYIASPSDYFEGKC